MRVASIVVLLSLVTAKTISPADREKACKGTKAKEWADCNYETCNGKKPLDVKDYPRCKFYDTPE